MEKIRRFVDHTGGMMMGHEATINPNTTNVLITIIKSVPLSLSLSLGVAFPFIASLDQETEKESVYYWGAQRSVAMTISVPIDMAVGKWKYDHLIRKRLCSIVYIVRSH